MKKVGLIILLIILMFGIGIGIGFYLSKGKKSNKCETAQEIIQGDGYYYSSELLKYHYDDMGAPGTDYYIELDFTKKKLTVEEVEHCSTVDCDGSKFKETIDVTDEEITMIKKVLKNISFDYSSYNRDLDYLTLALADIARDNTPLYRRGDNSYNSKYDTDDDGFITYRENADATLESMSKKKGI